MTIVEKVGLMVLIETVPVLGNVLFLLLVLVETKPFWYLTHVT